MAGFISCQQLVLDLYRFLAHSLVLSYSLILSHSLVLAISWILVDSLVLTFSWVRWVLTYSRILAFCIILIFFISVLSSRMIQINVQLRKHLDSKLILTRKHIDHYSEMNDKQKKVLQELNVVMKRADDLLQECKNTELWPFGAVTLTDIKEDVLEIELDIAWWTRMLDISTGMVTANDVIKAVEELNTCYDKLSDDLQKAACEDKERLQSYIEEDRIMHSKWSDQYLLLIYLLSRLKDSKGDPNILVDDIELLDKHFRINLKKIKNKGTCSFGTLDEVTWLQKLKDRKWAMKTIFHANESRLEAKFMRSCNHPHIVQFIWSWEQYDSEKAQICSHILMELMPMDLSTLIRNQRRNGADPPFELHVAIDIMLQIAKAMRYLHGKKINLDGEMSKITHRDLKPGNVLVEQLGTSRIVKLACFGISKVNHGTETTSTLTAKLGTSVYAAPEVVLPRGETKEPTFPPKADVWSFAMTCSEILTGNPPFNGLPYRGLHNDVNNGIRPDLPTDLPECLILHH